MRADEQLGSGGEARIFGLGHDSFRVAKVWHKPTSERARKVQAMLANPPVDPMAGQGHVAIAWPSDLLLLPRAAPEVCGFVMPRVSGMHPIIDFFNPRTRLQRSPLFNWFYLHRTARNLVTAIRALHDRGYVVGDINESNLLVSETALVTIVDTDSFQVWDTASGTLFRCRVGRPEFTPPELQGQSFARVNREPAQDHFGIGTLVFQLLMEGTHPFAGVYHGPGEAPVYADRIAGGHFPHVARASVPYTPMPAGPRFNWLHPVLQDLFVRCFCDGHTDPALRPDAVSWRYGIEEAEASLVSCQDNAQHIFSNHLTGCPWCERRQLLGGRDPFPSAEAVQRGEHLKPAPRRRRPAATASRPPATHWSAVFNPTRSTGPAPPQPRPIPPSRSRAPTRPPLSPAQVDALQQAFGALRRNEWAGAAFALAVLGLVLTLSPVRAVTAVIALLGILTGLVGEYKAGDWQCAGRGRGLSRAAIVVGAIDLVILSLL